jgi:HupE / UreJ protein
MRTGLSEVSFPAGDTSIYVHLLIVLLLASVFAAAACAHDMPRSESQIEVAGREVHVVLKLNLLELGYVDTDRNGIISYDELDNSIERIYRDIKQHFIIQSSTLPVETRLKKYDIEQDHGLRMELEYVFAQDVSKLQVTSTLDQIAQPGHEHFVTFSNRGTVQEAILNAATPTVEFKAGQTPYLSTVWSFVRLGILHIFTGYDHLAFLVGLLIVTTNLTSLVKVISAFTLAHSITLALSTCNIVVLPSRLTESMIPLTIAYVAVENILRKHTLERYYVTFIFGLIHGFGFSNVLREMQLSQSHLALSLFSFNLGVEIGQLAFILVLFPLVLWIASLSWRRPIQAGVSVVIICLAAYWFLQRAFMI